jgi:type II secretory pathway component GspD/PulD (secretin)
MIDAEEWNQKLREAERAADAGFAAYNRGDYAHAGRIFAAIDPQRLGLASPAKAGRLREIMMTPEMTRGSSGQGGLLRQPGRIAVAQARDERNNNSPLLNGEGKARATDAMGGQNKAAGDNSQLANVAAMQEVKFQQMHQESIRVQKEAMERFKVGETNQALEMLKDFSGNLNSSDLDPGQIALLRRPIEDRLKRLGMLKLQKDFEKGQLANNANKNEAERRRQLQEQEKQKTVASLMKQYHDLYQQGKYAQAMTMAEKTLQVDPDNVAASAGAKIAQMAMRHEDFHNLSKQKEQDVLDALNDTDDEGPSMARYPIHVNPKYAVRTRGRKDMTAIWPYTKSQKEREIERRLLAPINLNFKNAPLKNVIEDLRDLSGVNVVPDTASLEEANVEMSKALDFKVENISLKSALNLLLKKVNLTYFIKDEALQITTTDKGRGGLKRVVYPVADLVVPVNNHALPTSANIYNYLNNSVQPPNPYASYSPTPYMPPYGMFNGQPVSTPTSSTGGTYGGPPMPQQGGPAVTFHGTGETIENLLIKLITNTVEPSSWSDVGGQGTIQYFPLGLALVVNQSLDLQEQVQDLLAALRRLQDLEVAIEMRLVSVSESFFERIGLDFNINIVNQNHKFDNNLLNGQFQPFGFINKFTPNGFASGMTPARTLTPDLGIPIRQDSFALTTPPFGYPGLITGDGGLSLGLAFLSDIQVFMFMEAAQGDRRFNIMQAPKLTMFNGQSATLTVTDFQFFLTSVTPATTATGQMFFIPANQPVPLGVSLAVQPVVSADRRFVRMNLNPVLTNLTNANVPLFPIQIPVPQIFEGGVVGPGQGGLFQIFLQQPTFTTISIMTTVSVPDGGTVLLGGLKTLSEGRSEFGPPILSKIPYLNRLFKNVGYGREAQSLLIMVTPRIIINEEEEIRATGGVGGVPVPGGGGAAGG